MTDAEFGEFVAKIKSEAYKEFAERLKKKACAYDLDNYHSFDAVEIEWIDDLLEEMEQ